MARPKGVKSRRRSELELISEYEEKIRKLQERLVRKNSMVLASMMSDIVSGSGQSVDDFLQGYAEASNKDSYLRDACVAFANATSPVAIS